MRKPRLLLVDDEPAMRQLLTGFLSEDYDVVGTAQDGATMVTAALHLKPDVIVSDIEMPGINGIQAARQLDGLLPNVRIVFLSSHGDGEHVAAAFAAGAAGYLVKGESPDLLFKLSRTIESLCNTSAPGGRLSGADRAPGAGFRKRPNTIDLGR